MNFTVVDEILANIIICNTKKTKCLFTTALFTFISLFTMFCELPYVLLYISE